ncbi:MAG: hypothetical protein IJ236_04375 [Oscillospiraceae bacterium]|nr:hypothetical protein [Oscillospiraceae bacterium]MBQ9696293.1 hypothetical protein [Oscillospiraceae bacterium]MBR1459382.1 hypothetical protein [Oscillospiraceae bacterium]MBR1898728.1 hypothetical protein [Oscillospiraceae bacterium]
MKYECPHCHEKTFTPLQKALCGSYRTMGKPCPKCGRRACNGMTGIYFQSVTSIAMIIAIITIYLKATERVHSSMLIGAIILGYFVVNFIFNMFFGKLTEPIRTMR